MQSVPYVLHYPCGIVGWLSETEEFMLRQTTLKIIAVYPRLSHEDEQSQGGGADD